MLAEGFVNLVLAPQPDHQAQRLFHCFLLGRISGQFAGFRHQRIVNFDIGPHLLSIECVRNHPMIHIASAQQPAWPDKAARCRSARFSSISSDLEFDRGPVSR
jgi:hypothetical protein